MELGCIVGLVPTLTDSSLSTGHIHSIILLLPLIARVEIKYKSSKQEIRHLGEEWGKNLVWIGTTDEI
jgi:hypothetical protein